MFDTIINDKLYVTLWGTTNKKLMFCHTFLLYFGLFHQIIALCPIVCYSLFSIDKIDEWKIFSSYKENVSPDKLMHNYLLLERSGDRNTVETTVYRMVISKYLCVWVLLVL